MTNIDRELAGLHVDPTRRSGRLWVPGPKPFLMHGALVWDDWPRHPLSPEERFDLVVQTEEWRKVDTSISGPAAACRDDAQAFASDGGPELLSRFMQLYRASDEAILDFARRFGPLNLCLHGLVVTHIERLGAPRCGDWVEPQMGLKIEALTFWRTYAERAQAIVSITAAALHRRSGAAADRQVLAGYFFGRPLFPAPANEEDPVASGEHAVQAALSLWVADGGISLGLGWSSGRPSLQLHVEDLHADLGLRLLFAVTKTDDLWSCAGCQDWFTSRRTGGRGPNRYCADCRNMKRPQRDASRASRERQRHERVIG